MSNSRAVVVDGSARIVPDDRMLRLAVVVGVTLTLHHQEDAA
ncbi:MAG: hypothetical protein ABI411_07555 [Tahibacter sp.]